MDYSKYECSLDEMEEACMKQCTANADYFYKLEHELKKGLMNDSNMVHISLDHYNEFLISTSFGEIKPETIEIFCKNHNLKCVTKTKTITIDTNSPQYKYYFISDKKKFSSHFLSSDLTKVDDSGVIFNLLDEKEFRSIKKR